MLKVAICGGSGYAGGELVRLLSNHPRVKITAVTSEKSAGKKVSDLFPHLKNIADHIYEPLNKENLLKKADIFFMALPHAQSQETGDFFFSNRKKVIDLSADYRLRNALIYEEWYRIPHNYRSTLKKAVYGLPELYRKEISKAGIIANPGCYPTGAILGLYPALKANIIGTESIIIDSASGTTGAGRKSDTAFSYCEVNEGFRAYSVASHRHTPEIEQELSVISKKPVRVDFTPHLAPYDRGILSTIYAKIKKDINTKDVLEIYRKLYSKEPFVRIFAEGKYPNVKNVRGTNMCDIGLVVNKRTGTLIIVSAIDNLMKGAAGQAVHNMNIMMGFKETTALDKIALFP